MILPLVLAAALLAPGRLEPVVMTWYTEKGALAFPGAEKLRKGGK